MNASLVPVAILGVIAACDSLPSGAGAAPPRETGAVAPMTDWACDLSAGSCFCSADPPVGTLTSCPSDLPCCIVRRSDLGDTCECTPDDEVSCEERMSGDPTASQSSACPP